MSISIEIINADKVLGALLSDLVDLKKNKIPLITRQALNRTVRDVTVLAKKSVRSKFNLKLSLINRKRMITPRMAKGKDYRASLVFSGKPVSLINFLNNPQPTHQAHIPVKSRKPLRIKVGRSRTVLKTAFIQRGKKNSDGEGNLHVFKRSGGKTNWKKQSSPSFAAIFEQEAMDSMLRMRSGIIFEKNFKQRLDYELSKIRSMR